MSTLSPHIPQLYDSGGPPGLASPPSNPYAHSSPTHAITLWLWRTPAYPVLQATLMPTLSPHIPQLYGSGGPPGLPSPPSNPYAHSSPTHAITLWPWRSSRPTQSPQQPLWPLYPLKCHHSMALEDPHSSPVPPATPVATLSPQVLQLYGSGGPPGLANPPSNPYVHSIPTYPPTL